MKVAICYFSGTGNTKKVVDYYKECFEQNECEVSLIKMENGTLDNVSDYDHIGFAYPIHGFNAPSIVLDFAKKIDKQQNKTNYFILKTSGEPLKINNISSCKLNSILKRKNFVLTNEYHYVMPYNMIFRHSDAMAYKMWNTASRLIPIDTKEIINHIPVKLDKVFMGNTLAWIMRAEHWGGRIIGKGYKVTDKCLKCQKCVRDCPTQNITIENGKFKFGNKCLICTRCSFNCPVNAIKIGMLEGWKVNGAYNFNNPDDTYQKSHKNYCKRSYKKYFERSEAKINKHQ